MHSENKRILKNTLYLYIRMFLIMGIAFYTTRLVLNQLGVNDYGIYNVVGGIVSMFAVFSAALTGAISRFLTFEIGKGNKSGLNEIFSASLTILLVISALCIVLMEPIGVWFLNNKIQIQPDRLNAAHWVFQCSLITFCISILSIPYNALIVAHERMKVFAFISLLEAALKLGVAVLLTLHFFDSLKLYAVMIMLVALIIRGIYGNYAARKFKETHVHISFNKTKLKEILSFTGWTCIGGSASILNSQGVNILLNIFWGTTINAARGVASQVTAAVGGFSSNFMMAVNPQIIKAYANSDTARTRFLVFQSSRMAFFLMFIISLPIIIEIDSILLLWLKTVPDYSAIFIRLVLVQSLIDVMCLSLQTLNQASGKVKIYQIIAGGTLLLNFPLAYIVLKSGLQPQSVYFVAIAVSFLSMLARLIVLHFQIGFEATKFIVKVVLRNLAVGIIAYMLAQMAVAGISGGFLMLCFRVIIVVVIGATIILILGFERSERKILWSKVLSKIKS